MTGAGNPRGQAEVRGKMVGVRAFHATISLFAIGHAVVKSPVPAAFFRPRHLGTEIRVAKTPFRPTAGFRVVAFDHVFATGRLLSAEILTDLGVLDVGRLVTGAVGTAAAGAAA